MKVNGRAALIVGVLVAILLVMGYLHQRTEPVNCNCTVPPIGGAGVSNHLNAITP